MVCTAQYHRYLVSLQRPPLARLRQGSAALHGTGYGQSLPRFYNCAKMARENARSVRGNITSEMWEVLNATWIEMQNMDEDRTCTQRASPRSSNKVKERSHLFPGRDLWHHAPRRCIPVLASGHLHGAIPDNTARILDVKYHVLLPSVTDVGGAVDYYQWSAGAAFNLPRSSPTAKVYRDTVTPLKIAELLILRDDIPRRSLRFCPARCSRDPAHGGKPHFTRPRARPARFTPHCSTARIGDVFKFDSTSTSAVPGLDRPPRCATPHSLHLVKPAD